MDTRSALSRIQPGIRLSEALKRVLLGGLMLLGTFGIASRLEAQRVSGSSVREVTIRPDQPAVSVTIEGTDLAAVTGAFVEVGGRRVASLTVTPGRVTRSGLPLSIAARRSTPEVRGDLVLVTARGTLRTGVVVIVEAPAFTPVRLTTDQLRMEGWRFQPISIRAGSLTMQGWRFQPLSIRAGSLTMNGWRFQPVTIRTRPLTMIGHGSGREENR